MISVLLISAGVDNWDKYTTPAIEGLRKHATADIQLITVDNGGLARGTVNISTMIPYAAAVNQAALEAKGERLLILNNDIKVTGKWMGEILNHPLCGPGPMLKKEGITYLEGWALSIDRELWHLLNGFCEYFKNSWEDADFCVRARQLGVEPVLIKSWPVTHFWGKTRNIIPGSNKWDERNRLFFLRRKRRSYNIK